MDAYITGYDEPTSTEAAMHREASAAGRIRPDNTVTTLDKKQGRHFCRPYAYCLLVFDAVYCRGSSGVCGRSGSTETASDAVISSYRLLSRRLMPPSPLPEVPELVRSMSPHIAMSQSVRFAHWASASVSSLAEDPTTVLFSRDIYVHSVSDIPETVSSVSVAGASDPLFSSLLQEARTIMPARAKTVGMKCFSLIIGCV